MSGNYLFPLCMLITLVAPLTGCIDYPEDVLRPPAEDQDTGSPDNGDPAVEDAGPRTIDFCINPVDHAYFEEAADGTEVAIEGLQDLALQCVRSECFDAFVADEDADVCTASCLEGKAPAELSGACLDCFVEEALCFFDRCATKCIAGDPELCFACQAEFCTPAFEACTGLL